MFPGYFYNEILMRSVGGQGPSQSTIQAVHQAIEAQQQALQAQQQSLQTQQSIQPYYHLLQYYYPMYFTPYRIPFSTLPYENVHYL
ncbi:TPA: DUF3947 family protein [Bacillus toyonensis]|uniref:Uncharacterized protein n=1 Tax=Bacillus thuringiensis TaxID=1428 RepID=A0A9X7FY20_BACTU|nr:MULTISPECIES: DUF3947 family protein [Bacillus]MCQ6337069.1 DUF3947 family protein [Bacillus cereus]PFT51103.1 hypothetical protein COK72_01255 [Bacillus thuringiensis]HDR7950713.1 DUF3947 family protein [Bacillus toyonensis]